MPGFDKKTTLLTYPIFFFFSTIVFINRLHFKNVKHSDHGRYSCLLGGSTDTGMFSKWRNFTLITYKRSDAAAGGKQLKMTAPQSLSHRKDGVKPKFIDKLFMDNNIVMLIDDIRTLTCPFESKLTCITAGPCSTIRIRAGIVFGR